ncbi:MAG TPA: hypothetical protein DEQ14_00550 [Treponema sp.]|nr:hypothetical protein [Treponema sp.]
MANQKKWGILVLALVLGMCMAGCSNNSPSSVVGKFHADVKENNVTDVRQVCSRDFWDSVSDELDGLREELAEFGKITMTENVEGLKATVKCTAENGDTLEYNLEKLDGKWIITGWRW